MLKPQFLGKREKISKQCLIIFLPSMLTINTQTLNPIVAIFSHVSLEQFGLHLHCLFRSVCSTTQPHNEDTAVNYLTIIISARK